MKDKYKKLIINTIIFGIGGIGSKLIMFLLVPMYTNYLSTEEYGVIDLITTIGELLIPIAFMQISSSTLRFGLANKFKKENVLLSSYIVIIAGCVVVFLASFIISKYKAISEWTYYICVYLCISSINTVNLTFLKVINMNKFYSLLSIFQTLLFAILNIYFIAYLSYGIKGFLLSNIISIAVVSLLTMFLGNIVRYLANSHFDSQLTLEMIKFSFPVVFNDISWWIIHSFDKFIIEQYFGTSILGIYSLASKIPSFINVIISFFSQAWSISAINEKDSTNDSLFYYNVFEFYSSLLFVLTFFAIFVIKPFMYIYVGESFISSWQYVPVLIVSAMFSAFSAYCGSIFNAFNKNRLSMASTIIASIINIVLSCILVPKLSIWGACIATLVSYIFISIFRIVSVSKLVGFNFCKARIILNSLLCMLLSFLVIKMEINISLIIVSTILLIIINYSMIKEIINI